MTDITREQMVEEKRLAYNLYHREWRKKHLESVRERDRLWSKNNKEHRQKYDKEWKANNSKKIKENWLNWNRDNPLAHKAHLKVYREILNGNLKRPEYCSQCGELCKPHAHHKNYQEPLNVIWLCSSCHPMNGKGK